MSKGAQIIQGPVAFAVWYRVRNIIWIVSLTPPWNPPLFPIALHPKASLLALICVSLASIYHLELHELPAASQLLSSAPAFAFAFALALALARLPFPAPHSASYASFKTKLSSHSLTHTHLNLFCPWCALLLCPFCHPDCSPRLMVPASLIGVSGAQEADTERAEPSITKQLRAACGFEFGCCMALTDIFPET